MRAMGKERMGEFSTSAHVTNTKSLQAHALRAFLVYEPTHSDTSSAATIAYEVCIVESLQNAIDVTDQEV